MTAPSLPRRLPRPPAAAAVLLAVLALLAVLNPLSEIPAAEPPQDRPDVLFIAVDDLNDWIGALGGHPQAKTPHLDRLAARGTLFTRSYCASPLCGPSRTSLLYGKLPTTSGSYGHADGHHPVALMPEVQPLTAKFREAGYHVAGVGKIFHMRFNDERFWHDYIAAFPGRGPAGDAPGVFRDPLRFGPVDVDDDEIGGDMAKAHWAADKLREERGEPLFLAVGFKKPHMPWYAPRKYFDLHPLEEVVVPEAPDDELDDVPPPGRYLASPGVGFSGPPEGDHARILELGLWQRAVQAYLATCSFADACVGVVLDALEESGRADNTIVMLWSDHGWHLGEKHHWRKHALWERSTRTTMIVSVPGMTEPGSVCRRTVGLSDLHPTLLELCGLPVEGVEARSLVPLLENPRAEWGHPALSTYGPGNHSVRTARWRYTRYLDGSEELYDHREDPDEWTNLAARPEHRRLMDRLAAHLPATEAPDPAPDSAFNVLRQFLPEEP